MTTTGFAPGIYSAQRNSKLYVSLRSQLDDLQRQLSTGQRATTYGGLGVGRSTSLSARSALSALQSYSQNIDLSAIRLKLVTNGLENMAEHAGKAQTDLALVGYGPGADGRNPGQLAGEGRLKQALDTLNTEINGLYVFSGRDPQTKPVASYDEIVNGSIAGDGLLVVVNERKLADRGADGLGRLAVTGVGTNVQIAETVAGLPFGFKIEGAISTGAGIVATFDNSDPASVDFDVNAQPFAGDVVRVTLGLPDGTQTTISLSAANPPGPATAEQFLIGSDAASTGANLRLALTDAISNQARTSLTAASAVRASNDFFTGAADNPPGSGVEPPRVIGADPATATQYAAPSTVGSPKTTLRWYRGDNGAGDARATAAVRINNSEVIGIGTRANELGIRSTLANLAVIATETFDGAVTTDRDRYRELGLRTATNLSTSSTAPNVKNLAIELANVSLTLDQAKVRQTEQRNFLEEAVGSVEDVSNEEAAAYILTLQTRLEASYQVSSILSQLSLTRFL